MTPTNTLVERIAVWLRESPRRPANIAFTAGDERQIAYHIEDAINREGRAAIAVVLAELREPTEEMWGGLARDLMMWLDFQTKTPKALFAHLENLGVDIPQWLRDEAEMQHLDHVPSKGTRCVIIFKAMLAAFERAQRVEG